MKARNYREVKGAPYTRKKYMRGAPQSKIVKFTMGNSSGRYSHQLSLIADRRVQIRHNALEAARIAANRHLQESLGDDFFLRVLLLPHVVLRENKMIFGAHADRLQDGMRKAFGKPIGRAARVNPGQPVIVTWVNEDGIGTAKEALKRAGAKLPTPCRIVTEKLVKPSLEVKEIAD
ncbi:MAG: 50S ribosomal protein L16 [Candidatus Bathyarchaeota archaeon]|nr:50S ribosomal protein L16 [Candidatus Bathyarchaeota archaeon]